MKENSELTKNAATLLEYAGLSTAITSITPCSSGGNNRTYQLTTPDGHFALKQYFREACDQRDRLASEFAFLNFAVYAAPDKVPIPYSKNIEAGMALYEFIEGAALTTSDITPPVIHQAIEFFCELNHHNLQDRAAALPVASEACFSINEHVTLIQNRIDQLNQIASIPCINELNMIWEKLIERIHLDNTVLPMNQRCITPSDFGFHNALKLPNGKIKFIDFEYAGWDDPAKMTGDFFSQISVPVPGHFFNEFTQKTMEPFGESDRLIHRAKQLRPVYQMKWCCIALNIFIPANLARRQFANPNLNIDELKRVQLEKATKLLNQLEEEHGLH